MWAMQEEKFFPEFNFLVLQLSPLPFAHHLQLHTKGKLT